MIKTRYYQIDYAKTIAIFLVIIGHTIFQKNHLEPYLKQINLYIYSFHIPLFFILSGLNIGISSNSLPSTDHNNIFIKQLKKLFLPYLIWSFLYIIPLSLVLPYDFFGYDTVGEKIYSTITLYGISPLWFLSTLFIAQIIHILITKLKFYHNHQIISHTIVLLISFWLSIHINKYFQPYPQNLTIFYAYPIIAICRVFPALFFFEIGFLFSKIWEKYIKLDFIYRLFSFIIVLLIIYFFKNLFLYKNYLYVFIIQDIKSFFITGFLGSFSVICFCCLLNKDIKIISEIGKRTMDIMALHHNPIPIAYLLSYIFALLNFKNSVFIYSILILITCCLVSKLICDRIRLYFKSKT